VKLFSQNSNVYDHDTSTSQTDRRTDRQMDNMPWQYRVASLGNKNNRRAVVYKVRAPSFGLSQLRDTRAEILVHLTTRAGRATNSVAVRARSGTRSSVRATVSSSA